MVLTLVAICKILLILLLFYFASTFRCGVCCVCVFSSSTHTAACGRAIHARTWICVFFFQIRTRLFKAAPRTHNWSAVLMSEIKKKKQNPKLPFPVHSHLTYEFEHYFELAFNTNTYTYTQKRKTKKAKAQRPHGDMWMPLWICSQEKVCIIRAFQDHPKSYVEWAITQIPPISRAIRDPQCSIHRTCVRSRESIGHGADLTENDERDFEFSRF